MYNYNIRACSHQPHIPAVQRCCEARNKAMHACKESELERHFQFEHNRNKKRAEVEPTLDKEKIQIAGAQAYTATIPALAGRADVQDFIACIAHGMTIGAIDPTDGPKLLYAAQVSLSGFGKEKAEPAQSAA